MLARAMKGAHHLEADGAQVLATFTGVVDACKGYLWSLLNEAAKNAESYADRLATETTATPAPPPQQPPAQPPAQPEQRLRPDPAEPPVLPAGTDRRTTARTTPPVVPNSRQKTVGRWIGPDGTAQPIQSGFDQRSALVQSQLARMGLPDGSGRSGDVEQKLAAYMVANGIMHATLIISYRPCRGRDDSCDTLVPILLPKGPR
ncbi:DddA-like double-stranded DNA deaminase toxin [Saccharothrix tamanrassetensis]|uniref:DddA-like double-stranded DNA deaminase toxin n=1 Tax=Saccharothrix tamanrassetensis TaxID=1051531 RepID=UPI0035E413A0